MTGGEAGTVDLPAGLFGKDVNKPVLHLYVVAYLANQRQGTQSTKTRAEVSGGGKKPWKQKGTGRARQGSTRSPQWTHGGIAFGPKPRSYRLSLNKKVKRIALTSALSDKAQTGDVVVVDNLSLEKIRTKSMISFLSALNIDKKSLIVTAAADPVVVASASNIPGAKVTFANVINPYDILNCDKLILTKEALDKMGEVFGA